MQDAVTGYMLTALARLGDALFLTAGIVVGILISLRGVTNAGIQIELHVDATTTLATPGMPLPILVAVSGAALSGVCLTIASYAPLRSVATAGLSAGLAELVLIGLGAAGFGRVVATWTAAIGVGFLATLISIRRQAPALVTATAGIMPMLPGLAVFRAVFAFAVNDTPDGGLTQLLEAAATALALGSGVVLGEFLASPLRYGAGRIGDLFRIEGPPGLRRAVGRVVRLQPAKSQQPTGTGGQRWRSVALEPTTADDVDAGYRGDWPAAVSSWAAEAYSALSDVHSAAAACNEAGPGPALSNAECTSGGEANQMGAVIVSPLKPNPPPATARPPPNHQELPPASLLVLLRSSHRPTAAESRSVN